jgi:hypothetical protein
MKRLVLWNFLLAVCATAGIYELRREWIATKAQEQAVLLRKPVAVKTDPGAPPAKPAPFQSANYNDMVQKTLFAKDRNPNVEIVAPPAPPPPPPPPPMPALPRVYGVLGLPSGPVAIMAEKSGAAQVKVKQGDKIGEFKIAKLDTQRITLTWMDKTVDKSIDELLDRQAAAVAAAAESQARAASAAPAAPAAPAGPPVDPKLGIEIGAPGNSVRACRGDDTSPAGTVLDGYKKSVEKTPFGDACRWLQTK